MTELPPRVNLVTTPSNGGMNPFLKMYLCQPRPEEVDACKHDSITLDPDTNLDVHILYGSSRLMLGICNSCGKKVRTTQNVNPR